jgi:hypothetical protein
MVATFIPETAAGYGLQRIFRKRDHIMLQDIHGFLFGFAASDLFLHFVRKLPVKFVVLKKFVHISSSFLHRYYTYVLFIISLPDIKINKKTALSFRKTKESRKRRFKKDEKSRKEEQKGRITFVNVVELSDQTKPCQTKTEVILYVTFYHRNVQNEKRNSQLFRKNLRPFEEA